jgi:hypothetical protein
MRRTVTPFLFAAGLGLAGLILTGCKQGEGERCEVNNDCSEGLVCDNRDVTNGVCTSQPGGTISVDAGVDGAPGPDSAPPVTAEAGAADQGAATDTAAGDGAAAPAADGAPAAADAASPDSAPDAAATVDATPDGRD